MPGALDRLARACHPPGAHWFPEAANSCFPARAIESAKRLRSAQLPAPEPMVTLVVRLNRRADAAPMHTLSDVGRPCARARRARRSLGRAWTSCHLTAPPVSSYWWRSSESRAPDMCSYKTGQGAAQGSRRRRRSTACQDRGRGRGRCCTPHASMSFRRKGRSLQRFERFVRAGKHGGGRAPLSPACARAALEHTQRVTRSTHAQGRTHGRTHERGLRVQHASAPSRER